MTIDFERWRTTARHGLTLSVLPETALEVVAEIDQLRGALERIAEDDGCCCTPSDFDEENGSNPLCSGCVARRALGHEFPGAAFIIDPSSISNEDGNGTR